MTISQGDQFPKGVKFTYIPIDLSDTSLIDPLKCQQPISLNLDNLITRFSQSNFLLIVSVPGAWTPLCGEQHIPAYLQNLAKLKSQKIGAVVIIGANDPFVMNGWAKVLIKEYVKTAEQPIPELIFAMDSTGFSKSQNLTNESDITGFTRNKRYALLVDCSNREIKYLGVETERKVDKSGVDAVLAKL
ncbi:hypothetical protein KGF56_000666 [Candida oxycetoniae]|uniref:Redoxin domain-containing protein n=1 Tax=Candida oxycetoniae TaxID=497107 RepID=A0AAI9WZY0_9ASCO|nr:uncharacterized protein KGF56_000666 [Candida oxycetoniae]KAI3406534.2 hypothetical protein KGF56_000666 [Candida oxycetoniae]